MNKFSERIKILQQAEDVANNLEYQIKDNQEVAKDYRTQYEESIAEDNPNGNEWIKGYAENYETKVAVLKDLLAYLEKKYL